MTDALPAVLDVAVIGAGAAGIAAARRLLGEALSVAVFEARARVGGRALTLPYQGHGLDMGCGWLHSADENVLARMVPDFGFTVDKTPPPWEGQSFNLEVTPAEQAEFGRAFGEFEERVAEAAARGEDGPASDLFDPACRWNGRMDAVSGALNGARFSQVSIIDYDAYRDTGVNWRVAEGYGQFIAGLAHHELAGVTVRLDCPVSRIDRSGPILRLETAHGTVEARSVIITVPTAILTSGALRIDPAPEAWLEAASGVPLGLASKVHMAVEGWEDFPKDGLLWGRSDTADTGGYHLRPFGRPMIEGYYGGDLAWGLEGEGEAAFFAFAQDELVSLLGSNMRKRLSAVATTMWGVEPWSLGAYSHALPGHGHDRALLRAPLEDRLFLAGEATAPAFYGTAHGAWMEGERAAEAALTALGHALPVVEA
ncbi:NAD(P)/FAD-dependent oxidoreductase [Brevundimonas sp. Leaf363]|uniref:flavin monoamine oxidase family protein n=1 Tax=Brevundimonas sp. Leaf363 TaxID=1736353 RepID=UPI000A7DC340|nr:NAD(P)/FAD-dependent oxidoreductase [Brevundimonas sp. Leaf363]